MGKPRGKQAYMNYVCPNCYHNMYDCECQGLPYNLLWIDTGIQEHVRILNAKGYRTMNSCESHKKGDSIYISFAFPYGIGDTLPLPIGFTVKPLHGGCAIYGAVNEDNFELWKKLMLYDLLNWCNSLPEVNDD